MNKSSFSKSPVFILVLFFFITFAVTAYANVLLKFDDTIVDGVATDSSGNNLNGTCSGNCPTFLSNGGKDGLGAYNFDGINDQISVPNSSLLNPTSQATIAAWVKLNAVGAWHGIISKGNNNSYQSHMYSIEINDGGTALCDISDGNSSIGLSSNTHLTANTYYHVACTYDGANLKLYINGVLESSRAQTLTPAINTSPFQIGSYGGSYDYANAIIDDVRLYQNALSQSELQSLVSGGGGGGGGSNTAPVANAGPDQTITLPTSSVTVNGSATDPEGNTMTYSWTKISGGSATITSPSSLSTTITGLSQGTYTFWLTATDSGGLSNADAITIVVNSSTTSDTTAPTVPTNLAGTATSSTQINLTWTASTDAVGVTGYKIYRNGTQVATSTTNSYSNTGLTASTAYTFTVSAYDAAGNNSAQTSSISVSTQSGTASGNTFYISTTGSDSNNGTSATTPWQTIAKVNSTAFSPGASILFKRGDTFYGTIVVNSSGSSTNPITYGAYGTGAKPVITGLKTLTNWTSLGNGIYESSDPALLSTVNMITINGNVQPMGRYPKATAPNKGYLTFQSSSGTSSITSNAISGLPSFVGGQVVVRKQPWVTDKGTITSQTSNTVTYSGIGEAGTPPAGSSGFFFQNHVNTLTSLGEWAYNANTKKVQMYFGGASPSSYVIKASAVENLAELDSDYFVTFDNISFVGANSNAIKITYSFDTKIQNNDFFASGVDAISMTNTGSSRINIENNNISDSNNNAITVNYTSYCTIRNNTINNTGIINGAGSSGGSNSEAMSILGHHCSVDHNRITNTGYVGIYIDGGYTTVQNNFIDTFNLLKDDGGGIYTWNGAKDPASGHSKILNNIILNGAGDAAIGIYMDDFANDMEIKGNTMANNSYNGLYLHNATNQDVQNNTSYNNQYQWNLTNDAGTMGGFNIQNNIFFSKASTQLIGTHANVSGSISGWGTINNNYYARPLDTGNVYVISHAPCCNQWSFPQWKSATGYDSNTAISPVSLTSANDIIFEYNASDSPRVVSLSGSYKDAKNVSYSGSVTIPAWGSVVLMKAGSTTTNISPTANAGTDKSITLPTSSVSLVGSGTDSDGTIASYAWSKVSGGTATIATPTAATTNITGLGYGTYVFRLTVTDNLGATGTDDVQVTVAGPAFNVSAGADLSITLPTNSVYLNSTVSGGAVASTYVWSKSSGGTATIATPSTAATFINGLTQGDYIFQVTVTDTLGRVVSDSVAVTVSGAVPPPNVAPVANAGVDKSIVLPTSSVSLVGSGTDSDGTIASYAWSKVSGGTATISSPTLATTSITGLSAGSYTFRLTVTDNGGLTGTDDVLVTVSSAPTNTPPVANAGPDKTITLPTSSVSLVGSGTDSDGTIASYAWSKVSGGTATISSPTSASTNIINLASGTYTFRLTVRDNGGLTGYDDVLVTVKKKTNRKPTVRATTTSQITASSTLKLTATATDEDLDPLTYSWTQDSGPSTSTITSKNSLTTDITGLVPGTYVFSIEATDTDSVTSSETVSVIIPAETITKPDELKTPPTTTLSTSVSIPVNGVTRTSGTTFIKNLQSFLNWTNGTNLSVDGKWGAQTISAIKIFQKNNGLKADGSFGKTSATKARELLINR